MLIHIAIFLGIVAVVAWYLFVPLVFTNSNIAGIMLGVCWGSAFFALALLSMKQQPEA